MFFPTVNVNCNNKEANHLYAAIIHTLPEINHYSKLYCDLNCPIASLFPVTIYFKEFSLFRSVKLISFVIAYHRILSSDPELQEQM